MKTKLFAPKNKPTMNNILTAIDIGSNKVTGVSAIVTEEGKVHVLAAAQTDSKGVEEGVIQNIDRVVQSINKIVTNLNYKTDAEIKEVYLGVSGRNLEIITRTDNYIRRKHDTEITQEEVEEFTSRIHNILLPPGQVIVDVIPLFYKVDNGIRTKLPIGMHGKELKGYFKVITCQRQTRTYLDRCIEKAGLNLKGLMLNAEASAHACLSAQDMEAGVVVVDMGAAMTDIAFFYDGVLADLHLLPIGGNIVTNDIQDGCRILRDKAEKLKTRFGSAVVQENQKGLQISIDGVTHKDTREISMLSLAQIIEARMEDLSRLVFDTIDESGLRKHLLAGIVLTGGSAQLNNIEEHFEEATGLTTRIGKLKGFTASEKITRQLNNSYAAALGTVIKAAEKNDKIEAPAVIEEIEEIEIPEKTKKNMFQRMLDKWLVTSKENEGSWSEIN